MSLASLCSGAVLPREVINPVKSANLFTIVVGSCHGPLLLSNNTCANTSTYDSTLMRGHNPNHDVSVWNPSTGYHFVIPRQGMERFLMGFGYDLLHNDYKIVRIGVRFCDNIEMFSLRENNWREIGSFVLFPVGRGVYLNGKLHWTSTHTYKSMAKYQSILRDPTPQARKRPMRLRREPPVIMAIDLGSENTLSIQVFRAPPSAQHRSKMFLTVLGGTDTLCAILFNLADRITETWVLQEYGDDTSWERIMILEPTDPLDDFIGYTTPMAASLAYSENKDEILVEYHSRRFVWADKMEGQLKLDTRIDETEMVFPSTGCEVYMSSLVALRREGLAVEEEAPED